MNERQRQAFKLRAYHLNPLPFYHHSKTPAFAEGEIFKYRGRRATDVELRQLFADDQLNIGVFTDRHHIVVDVDGAEGQQSLKGLALPSTVTVLRDESHMHLHFRQIDATDPCHTRIKALPGVDILADDWQVLMPTSYHPEGARYHFAPELSLANIELALPPPWVRDLYHTPALDNNCLLSFERELVSTKTKSLLESGRACVATDVPDGQVESLLAPCTFPTTIDALGGWPELLSRRDVNMCTVGKLGLLAVPIGERMVCPMPGHPHDSRATSLYWDDQGKNPTGMLKLRDWHYATGDGTYNQADIFAARSYGKAHQLKGPEITVWQLRLLLVSGVLLPYPIPTPALPLSTPTHIRRVYDGFLMLLRCKWLHTPDEPTPYTWRFSAAWCGMRSVGQVLYAMRWLISHGYIRQVGTHKRMALFLPGGQRT